MTTTDLVMRVYDAMRELAMREEGDAFNPEAFARNFLAAVSGQEVL